MTDADRKRIRSLVCRMISKNDADETRVSDIVGGMETDLLCDLMTDAQLQCEAARVVSTDETMADAKFRVGVEIAVPLYRIAMTLALVRISAELGERISARAERDRPPSAGS